MVTNLQGRTGARFPNRINYAEPLVSGGRDARDARLVHEYQQAARDVEGLWHT
jgi:hypothetical protein